MRSVAAPVAAITALLVGVVSAAPAPNPDYGLPPSYTSAAPAAASSADSSANTPAAGTSTPTGTGGGIIVVPIKTCGSPAAATSDSSAVPVSWTPTEKHQKACEDSTYINATADNPLMPADWKACAALYSEFVTFNGTFNVGSNTKKSGGGSSAESPSSSAIPTYGSGSGAKSGSSSNYSPDGSSSGGASSGTKSGTKSGSGSGSGSGSSYSPGGGSSSAGSSPPTYGPAGKRDYGYGGGNSVTIGGKKITYTPILKSESCVFALASDHAEKIFAMGDVDVSLIFKHALNKGSDGSFASARGSTKCAPHDNNKGSKGTIHFQMYYPGA